MPSPVIHCVLCDRRERIARSKLTIITTVEREQKVYEGYKKRFGQPLNYSLLNKTVHTSCYKTITVRLKSLSNRSITSPHRCIPYDNCCISMLTNESSHECSSIAIERNSFDLHEPVDVNENLKIDLPMVDNSCVLSSNGENDDLFSSNQYTHSFDTSNELHNRQPFIDRTNEDVSLSPPDINYCSTIAIGFTSSQLNNESVVQNGTINGNKKTFNMDLATNTSSEQSKYFIDHSNSNNNDVHICPVTVLTPERSEPMDSTHYESNNFQQNCIHLDTSTTSSSNTSTINYTSERCITSTASCPHGRFKRKLKKKVVKQIQREQNYNVSSSRRSFRIKSTFKVATPNPETSDMSRFFSTSFDELCSWLIEILNTGVIISIVDVSCEYKTICQRRKETLKPNMLRTSSIQSRLIHRYGDMLHFEKRSNNEGIFVGLSDPSVYIRCALSKPSIWQRADTTDPQRQEQLCERFIDLIEQLRSSLKNNLHIIKSIKYDESSLANFDSDLYWACIPLLLKNFIGMLTLNDDKFSKMKNEYEFYDIQTKDLFNNSAKWLKIASICYDLIYTSSSHNITPKHYLLGNELYRHGRSEQLLTITNRLGYTPSYKSIVRLHTEAAERSRKVPRPFFCAGQYSSSFDHNFVVKVADNFDLNPDRLHGNNSIHILNQIIISTPENNELPIVVAECLDDIVHRIIAFVSIIDATPITTCSSFSDKMFINQALDLPMLAYCLIKFANDTTRVSFNYLSPLIPRLVPILSGFFSTYLNFETRPLHLVSFLTPITDDPSSESAAKKCLEETKQLFIDSMYQKEGVVVVDEKIYRSCMKVKYRQPDVFKNIFIYPGDFHLMKNMMVVLWNLLKGSGIEDVFENIYKDATLSSVFEVRHFNRSLRCCKLLYTALHVLCIEAFFDQTSISLSTSDCMKNLKSVMLQIPSEYAADDISQKWFAQLLQKIEQSDFSTYFYAWAFNSSKANSTFRLWYFILHRILKPILQLYMSIRTCNFEARNAALYQFAPIFFTTSHRNYSRLVAQHLYDLQSASPYLLSRMARSFAVTRSQRKFSSIALDQTIECTINKYGKGSGGINGRQDEQSISNWTHSFAFRSLLSSTLHEICGVETHRNSIDSHIECSPNRKAVDEQDLSIIVKSLRNENIFTSTNKKCHKILSGLIIHDDIIENITSSYERGEQYLSIYINERLVHKKVPIDAPLRTTPSLKLKDANTYVPNIDGQLNNKRGVLANIKDYNHLAKIADHEIRRIVLIAQQRNLKPLSQFFSFEFSPVPLSLCDNQNIDLLNQQTKATVIDILNNNFSSSFSSSCSISTSQSAIVIDGRILFETKPNPEVKTIRDYAIQLLENDIRDLFYIHDRIDVIFDPMKEKNLQQFSKIQDHRCEKNIYQLRGDDKIEKSFKKFVQSNPVTLARCICTCWMESELIQRLPPGRLLVVGRPDLTAVKLKKGDAPEPDYLLETNQDQSRTRILLHTNSISLDQYQKKVFINTTDTDIVLLAIAFGSSIILQHLVIKLMNIRTQKITYIDAKSIVSNLRQSAIDPICLLVLHALSGCSATSFIRNITKEKVFSCFFNNPQQYASINKLNCIPPPNESIAACERLVINCYSFGKAVRSLDELRAVMADIRIKNRARTNIASSLPPSTAAFKQHCLRAARQVKIWIDCFDSYPIAPSMLDSGYENTDSDSNYKIKWTDLPEKPYDPRLDSCGECKSNCNRFLAPISQTMSLTQNDSISYNNADHEHSADESQKSDNYYSDTSFISQTNSIYYQTDDSEVDTDNENENENYNKFNFNKSIINTSVVASENDPNFSILHDHNYSFTDFHNDSILNVCSTPKRQRTSSSNSVSSSNMF
ncbi:unnamed protein product [Rotaria sp. Silwood1]|nr:unnamed protein product [Rotaria sp. Silwood1]